MMENQHKYVKEIYRFAGQWEMPSHCGIMIRKVKDSTVIILTELYESNPGSSVTAMIQTLAVEIVKEYAIAPGSAIFIVRNPERSSHYTFYNETFYRAGMNWNGEKYVDLEWEKLDDINFI